MGAAREGGRCSWLDSWLVGVLCVGDAGCGILKWMDGVIARGIGCSGVLFAVCDQGRRRVLRNRIFSWNT